MSVQKTFVCVDRFARRLCTSPIRADLPSRAQVVVCGGGVAGSSVALHLSQLDFKDVVHLEQGSLTGGTTWHSAGLLSATRSSRAHAKLARYSNELYSSLESSGLGTGIKKNGYLYLATTSERLKDFRRYQAIGKCLNIKSEIVTPEEVSKICPILRTDDVVGALYAANDFSACDPSDVCRAMATQAKSNGVKFYDGVQVNWVDVADGKVAGVKTNKGDIECEIFVNCAGLWARQLGTLSNPRVNIPLHSTEHFYIVTKPFEDVDVNMPVVRDQDNQMYIRQWSGGIMLGYFELNPKPCFHDGVPDSFEFQLLPEDWEHCEPLVASGLYRVPAMEKAEIRQMINGPESFTPDMHAIMGEAPEVRNYYVAAGMNSYGIATSGGIGKALADWIALGEPPSDLWEFDIARFSPHQANLRYLRDRSAEALTLYYAVSWPKFEMESGRGIKATPFHCRLDDAGAHWGCVSGWERPNWFSRTTEETVYSFGKPNFFEFMKREHLACRGEAALFDLSPFVKIEIEGKDALSAVQRVCSNNVDVPVSHVVYTGMLNNQGGYQTDCTVTRLGEQKFLAVCPSAQPTHITAWLKRNIPSSITVRDNTSQYCVLGLMGPKSREVLQPLTSTSLENSSFPFGTSQVIDIGFASNILALRVSYVGELGWELHIPTEYGLHVFDQLREVGRKFGLQLAGSYAMDTLRLEKGYRHWSHELDSETTPLEARLMHAVDLKKGDFIGREALLKQKASGVKWMLGTFKLNIPDDEDVLPWGKEVIYRNGNYAGYVTSAGYGFSVGGPICMGFVSNGGNTVNSQYLKEGQYEIEIDGKRWSAELSMKSFYDPKSVAMKV